MAKQMVTVVIRLSSLTDSQRRSKVLKTAAGFPGVTSASLEGDRLIVVGAGVDPVAIAAKIRRKFGSAELVSVGSWSDMMTAETMYIPTARPLRLQPAHAGVYYDWPYQAANSIEIPPTYSYPNQHHYQASSYDPSCSIM